MLNTKKLLLQAIALLLFSSLILFTSCEESTPTTIEHLNDADEFVEVESLNQKVITISTASAKLACNAILNVKGSSANLIENISANDFTISPVFELPNPEIKEKAFKNKITSKPSEAENIIEIKISNVDLPVNAIGYQLNITRKDNMPNASYILTDEEGNRRSATVSSSMDEEILAASCYMLCESYELFEPLIYDTGCDALQVVGIDAEYSFPWAPENVAFSRVDVIFNDSAEGDFAITFSIPGSCTKTEGCNPNPQTQEFQICGPSSSAKTIPNFTLQQMSKLASTDLKESIQKLTPLYVKNRSELNKLYNSNEKVKTAMHQFIANHKILIVNSFAGNEVHLTATQVQSAIQLMELIQENTNDKTLSNTIEGLKKEVNYFKGKSIVTALKQMNTISIQGK